ncbi:HAD-IIIA family hydrolase [Polynucleobacter sp. 30F-ANTBAC]|uniref:HAD-IIIA family hydrolase n=1 Tax=Polynucleobacter sp. 30F-ANTBAC TaxID=2689095 RepID=UPI001C0E0AE8|nr:HAD-IIIA family hydrolase [Polynucleobacter sp. 30F-ANTBAC]MBU3599651.1 HAD-IIIA family hydrolase [Polynucleobacter sp. 30F-ANTBAC]
MIKTTKKCQVAILAGGMGTRLRERSGDMPKPMVPVLGKPVLHHQIELCRKHGFTDIALLVQHRYEKISEYFGDGSAFGVNLKYAIEDKPRGTAGALHDALPMLADRILVLYGDTFMDVDLRKLWMAHESSGAVGTLFLHPNDHPHDSDIVDIDKIGMVREILPYPHPEGREVRNLVNAALYVLNRAGLEDVTPAEGKADIAKHMFPRMLDLGRPLYGYVSPEYIKDMGTPERLDKVERDFLTGLPERLSGRQLRSAVFLDRDGTINREVTHLKLPDQIELLPGTAAAIRRLNCSGTLAVVVTNQPVVARGDVSIEGLRNIHARMESQLGAEGAFIDSLYFCPHHPDKGFPGEIVELKGCCNCRKPEPGLIDKACSDLGIGRQDSWMVGDATSDVEAGRRAGVRTILLRSGHGGADAKYAVRPDYTAPDLADAIDWILSGHADLTRRLAPIAIEVSHGCRLVLIGGLARTGKSYAAQVLKELLHMLGRKAHVISLDGWLKPKSERREGIGVRSRYDLATASAAIAYVAKSSARVTLREPLYDRLVRDADKQQIEHSLGPNDVLIVEGVPALLMDDLLGLSGVIKIYVDVSRDTREIRLNQDYAWRGFLSEEQFATLASRELDEVPIVGQSRMHADFVIGQES